MVYQTINVKYSENFLTAPCKMGIQFRTDIGCFWFGRCWFWRETAYCNWIVNGTPFYFICCSVILKSLRFFSHTIRDYFFQPFEHQAWNNFFHCAIAFLTQPALQLDVFSQNKRARIVGRYKDMRRETGFEIRSMWFNLGKCPQMLHIHFIWNLLSLKFSHYSFPVT